jgi:hypothetical protein
MSRATKRPSQKVVEAVTSELEKVLRKEHVKVIFEDTLAQILFLPIKMIPVAMTDVREELSEKGYLLFYSSILEGKGKQEFLSFNLTKLT